jgi:hypothetical protein
MIIIDEKFLVIKEINGYLVVMILINSFRSGVNRCTYLLILVFQCDIRHRHRSIGRPPGSSKNRPTILHLVHVLLLDQVELQVLDTDDGPCFRWHFNLDALLHF